jgi:hypothetical protein
VNRQHQHNCYSWYKPNQSASRCNQPHMQLRQPWCTLHHDPSNNNNCVPLQHAPLVQQWLLQQHSLCLPRIRRSHGTEAPLCRSFTRKLSCCKSLSRRTRLPERHKTSSSKWFNPSADNGRRTDSHCSKKNRPEKRIHRVKWAHQRATLHEQQ